MNLGALLLTVVLVIPAELPDKTFISMLLLSSRSNPLAVWVGGASALVVQAAVAVVAGRLLALLPSTALHSVVAAVFILGACYLIFLPEKEPKVEEGDAEDELAVQASFWRPAATAFGIVVLAEFGDITQILIANLTARFNAPVSVFIGAAIAFLVVSAAGVLAGRAIVRVVSLSVIRRISGLLLLGIGVYSVVSLL